MFMRYRGGGVGHKYMRDIEEKYENMSLERIHGSPPRQHQAQANAMDVDGAAGSSTGEQPRDPAELDLSKDGEQAESSTHPRGSQEGTENGTTGVSEGRGLENGGVNENESEDEEPRRRGPDGVSEDDMPADPEDSDEIESDFGYDSYGYGES